MNTEGRAVAAHGEGGCSIRDTHASSKHCEHSPGKSAFVLGRVCASAYEGAKTIRPGCFSKWKLTSTQSHPLRDVILLFYFSP